MPSTPSLSSPLIATPALSDSPVTVLTGGDTAGSMPLAYLQSEQPSDRARFTDLSYSISIGIGGTSSAFVVLDFGVPINLHFHYFGFTNVSSDAQIRKRGSTNPDPQISPGYDSTLTFVYEYQALTRAGFRKFPHVEFSASGFGVYRYWRFDFIDPDNINSYLDIGRMALASFDSIDDIAPPTLYQFPRGVMANGSSVGFNKVAAQVETAGRQIYPVSRPPLDQNKLSIAAVKESDIYGALAGIERTRSNSRSVIWCGDPSDTTLIAQKTIYGLMTLDDHARSGFMAGVGQVYAMDGTIVGMI